MCKCRDMLLYCICPAQQFACLICLSIKQSVRFSLSGEHQNSLASGKTDANTLKAMMFVVAPNSVVDLLYCENVKQWELTVYFILFT